LKRRNGLPKRSKRQLKSERGVVNERNVCSQERDKGRVDTARQRQQALFEERAHTAALNRRLAVGRGRDGEAQIVPLGLRDAPAGAARPTAVIMEAAERAIVEPGVEPIANTNRIVPAVGGEARDSRKRVTFADAVAAHVDPVAAVCRPACGVDVGPLEVQHSEPVVVHAARSLAPRRNASASSFDRARRTIGSTSLFSNTHWALTLVNNGGQQHAEHTSVAKLFHCFLSW
jgi:hypothetical protein